MSRDITEADWAMADRIIKMQQISPPLSERHKLAYASMLVRNGVMNSIPVDVDPDIEEADKVVNEFCESNGWSFENLALKAIKRGRALAAEAKQVMVWVKYDGSGKCPAPLGFWVTTRVNCGGYVYYSTQMATDSDWPHVTHYAIIIPPEDK